MQLKKSKFYEIKEYQFSQCTCLFLHILRYKSKMQCNAIIRPGETDGLALEWRSDGWVKTLDLRWVDDDDDR